MTTPSPAVGSEELRKQIDDIVDDFDFSPFQDEDHRHDMIAKRIKDLITAQNNATYEAVKASIPADNYAPTGDQRVVEAVNAERQRFRQSIAKIFGKEDSANA